MIDLTPTAYLWIKAFHIVAVVAWMAGLLYLPRLFVYHAQATPKSEASETFKVMERRLLRGIMNPAMILTFILGGLLAAAQGAALFQQGWIHAKLALALGLAALHGMMAGWRRAFAEDRNTRSARFYRIANEVPTVLLIAIILLAVLKPF